MGIAVMLLSMLLIISGACNLVLVDRLGRQREEVRRLERDQRIGELERQIWPAESARQSSPLANALAALIGIWVADHARRRRY